MNENGLTWSRWLAAAGGYVRLIQKGLSYDDLRQGWREGDDPCDYRHALESAGEKGKIIRN